MELDGRPIESAKISRLLMIDDDEVKDIVSLFKKKIQEE